MRSHSTLMSCLLGSFGASLLFALRCWNQDFTFMADDYHHLVQSYSNENLFWGHFSGWLSRVPVWALLSYSLFVSHILEHTWRPLLFFFLAHALGIALISARLLELDLFRPKESQKEPHSAWIAVSTALVCFYPNFHEILYWPTCMPYALGALFMGMGLYAKRGWMRTMFLFFAFLTYETFIIPSFVLVMTAAVFSPSGSQKEEIRKATASWATAAVLLLATRGVWAKYVGQFHHGVNFDLVHIATHLIDSASMLFRFKHSGFHTNYLATGSTAALLIASLLLLPHRRRAAALIFTCFLSTGLFWVLGYGALRSVYGAQVLLCGVIVIFLSSLRAATKLGQWLSVALAIAMSAGFFVHNSELWGIKGYNAGVLKAQEISLSTSLITCTSPCIVKHRRLDAGLKPDWVLPRDYWGSYLEWIRLRYAPQKNVIFEQST